MADGPTLSPEVSRSVSALARTLVAALQRLVGLLRPHLSRIRDRAPRAGAAFDEPVLVTAWEADGRGDYTWSMVEAVDPDEAGIEPLQSM